MHKWDDQTLEAMRTSGDPLADETVLALETFGEAKLRQFFKDWRVGAHTIADPGLFAGVGARAVAALHRSDFRTASTNRSAPYRKRR